MQDSGAYHLMEKPMLKLVISSGCDLAQVWLFHHAVGHHPVMRDMLQSRRIFKRELNLTACDLSTIELRIRTEGTPIKVAMINEI